MKYKGLNITVPEWVKFNDTQIIPYKTLIKNTIKVQLKNKVYYLNSKSICEKTPFKDFQGNNIYLNDLIQYETYNASNGQTVFHIRQVWKNAKNVYYLGKAAGFSKIFLSDLSNMNILNAKIIGNSFTDDLKEGNYSHLQK